MTQLTVIFLALAVLLGVGRLLGEVARRLRQPAVVGEILAGIFLGPTVLGRCWPEAFHYLFPESGPERIALDGFVAVAVVLLLLIAGLEVELSSVFRQGKAAVLVSVVGMVIPFTLGAGLGWLMPTWLGMPESGPKLAFSMFMGIALSISALPVIARILLDLNLFRTDLGMLIMSAGMLNDVVGWLGFALVLALMPAGGPIHANPAAAHGVGMTAVYTLLFMGLMLTAGRWLIDRALPYVQAYTVWPGGVLGAILVLTFLGAALTEHIGIHAIFGAFIVGVAIGDSSHLRERTRDTIHQFINNIFTPVFFASIGLRVDFIGSFSWIIVPVVLAVAVASKLGGGWLGARWSGMEQRERLVVGWALCARGAMEIILGQIALSAGLITPELFVAIVIMAVLTSMAAGPMIQRLMGPAKHLRLHDAMSERQIVMALDATDSRRAIDVLAVRAAELTGLAAETIAHAVWRRERIMSTGLFNSVAIPHGRLPHLKKPLVVLGRCDRGVDFDSPDGEPARIICLLLTPRSDPASQVQLLAMVSEAMATEHVRRSILAADSATKVLAALNVGGATVVEPLPEAKPKEA